MVRQGAFPANRQIGREAKRMKAGNGWAPASAEPRVMINLGCGPHQILPDHLNVDLVPHNGVDVVQNLFVFPWKVLENHYGKVDKIFCSHLVEHIPHDVQTPEDYPLRDHDGFYCFFFECWKLLKPTGYMEVVVPHARSNGAFQDPTHRRFLVETSFSYLNPGATGLPYVLPFAFNQKDLNVTVDRPWAQLIGIDDKSVQDAVKVKWNAILEFKVILQPIK